MNTHQTIHKAHRTHKNGLLVTTAHNVEEKVVNARNRLASAMENGKEVWNTVQTRTVAGAKATDKAIREHPYQSVGVALGIGALIGYLLRRRN